MNIRKTLVLAMSMVLVAQYAQAVPGTFTIDPTRAPKTIDVALDGSGKDQTKLLGIYRIEGDTRTSRFALPNNARPVDFGPAREGTVGFTWKRQSP